jgi:hypothetical protein
MLSGAQCSLGFDGDLHDCLWHNAELERVQRNCWVHGDWLPGLPGHHTSRFSHHHHLRRDRLVCRNPVQFYCGGAGLVRIIRAEHADLCHNGDRWNAARYLYDHGERHFAGNSIGLWSEHASDSRRTLGRYKPYGMELGGAARLAPRRRPLDNCDLALEDSRCAYLVS